MEIHRPSWLARRNLVRFELGCVAAFHLIIALIILLAPEERYISPGTAAIFGTIPPDVWAGMLLCTATAAAAATVRPTPIRLWLTWCQTFPVGCGWVYGFSTALANGHGSAIFPVVWVFLLIWWVLTAVRTHNGEQENRWDGS